MKCHIVLTKNDAEIICFKKSLGSRKFSSVVAEILKSAVNGKVAVIPMNFEIDTEVQPAHAKVTLPDQLADAEKARRTLQKYNADRNSDKVSDMTFSKETRSMLIMDDGSIGLSSVNATVLVKRANGEVD